MKKKHNPLFTMRDSRGFTLLLSALVASIVLTLGAAIFQIAQKEVILSSIGRDSQFAFYAADTAAECALYWDFRCNYFATSTASINASCNNPTPSCNGQAMNFTGRAATYPYTMVSAQVNFFQDAATTTLCTQVSVNKSIDATTGAVRTLVHADGYSMNCTNILTSPRALQRSVELQY